ncbi:MAG TPA: carbohydrate kinase family protein [Thermomicrobiales bacterium]|nr:carbohydrate kinase family protein [Thermomicrobiales bacterium]
MLDRIRGSIANNPTIGVVGIASWDTMLAVDTMPAAGGFALVSVMRELPGGTSANAAVAAAALGARVELISAVGDDAAGRRLTAALETAGVDVSRVRVSQDEPTDQTTVITSRDPPNRTIFWRRGAIPRRGDRIDIDWLFTRQLVLLDSVDPMLRRFLIDLPVHTYPNVKILVPMTYVVDFPGDDELESIVRCDALVGSEHELLALTQCESLDEGIAFLQQHMRVANLRSVAVTRGSRGALAFDADRVIEIPAIEVDVVDTTGAGDAFAGAFAVALAVRLDPSDALVLANCVAGLSTRSLGAQTSLPTPAEVEEALRTYLTRVRL